MLNADTVDCCFRRSAEVYPDRIFLHENLEGNVRQLTYADAARRVAAAVGCLRAHGIKSGDHVVITAMGAGLSFALWRLACNCAGVVPAIIPPTSSQAALASLMDRLSATHVICPDAIVAKRFIRLGVPALSFADGDVAPTSHFVSSSPNLLFDEALAVLRESASGHDADSPYAILLTSGTTGRPKLVPISHRKTLRNWSLLLPEVRPSDVPFRVLILSSLSHGPGTISLNIGLAVAAEFFVPRAMDTEASLEEVRRIDPMHVNMTPRVLRALYQQHVDCGGVAKNLPLFGPGLHTLAVGGSRSDRKILDYLRRLGAAVRETYGSTETGFVAISQALDPPDVVGSILPDCDLRISEEGELLIKSPSMFTGYHGDEEATRRAFTADGYYRSGDACQITADNKLRFLDRKRDVLNIFEGANVYPSFLESRIEALPWVRQVVLVGDQLPYIAALIVVAKGIVAEGNVEGRLPEEAYGAIYAKARRDLGAINAAVDDCERVRRFVLLAGPLRPALYRTANTKTVRDRPRIVTELAAHVTALYGDANVAGCVPGADIDRRQHTRSEARVLVSYRVDGGAAVFVGDACDISPRGIRLTTSLPLPEGTSLVLRILDHDRDGGALKGRVAWSDTSSMGIHLSDTYPEVVDLHQRARIR